MRKTYKNKRDLYKFEAERNLRLAKRWEDIAAQRQEELKKLEQSKEKEERIKVTWFCVQCRVVQSGTLKYGVNIESCACLNCGAYKLLAVGKKPFGF